MKSQIGIDEVGRGAWAGPLLVVALRSNTKMPKGLRDSKLLSKKQREVFAKEVSKTCDIGEGWVEPFEIDNFGLTEAMRIGVKRALLNIGATYGEEIIIDGNVNYCGDKYIHSMAVINADDKHPVVSAASIVAKVQRDNKMNILARSFPQFGFEANVGYGTRFHINALKQYGVTQIHRKSYKPIKELLDVK
ncbi:ribonuclease HII [Candidatus Saccharibacteria bacterium]|nr:ribonuclease HII [Candidatus Saccharibacteria bacterium]